MYIVLQLMSQTSCAKFGGSYTLHVLDPCGLNAQVDLPKGGHGKCGGGPHGAGGPCGKEAEDSAGGGDDACDQQGKALVLAACQRTLAGLEGDVKFNSQQAAQSANGWVAWCSERIAGGMGVMQDIGTRLQLARNQSLLYAG